MFHQLPDGLKMQLRWLEKCFRGLYWNYDLKYFLELSDVIINIFKLGLVVLRIFCSSVFANDVSKVKCCVYSNLVSANVFNRFLLFGTVAPSMDRGHHRFRSIYGFIGG